MNAKIGNLNNLVNLVDPANGIQSADGKSFVYFRNLETHLITHIKTAELVVGCVAWLTHQAILQALANVPEGVSIIVQKEDFLRPDIRSNGDWRNVLRRRYSKLKSLTFWPDLLNIVTAGINGDQFFDPVRSVGIVNRNNAPATPRMHHKFLVFCRLKESTVSHPRETHSFKSIEPYSVWTGSFNFTLSGVHSLENAVMLNDTEISSAYYHEWQEVALISERLDWEQDWIRPERGVT